MYETMLIVDDTEYERDMLHELMQDNFTILEAKNGIECMEAINTCKKHIDVILLDLLMPEMDGFAVLKERQKNPYFMEIPVIVLTASGDVEDQVKAFELGANDFISKPIDVNLAIWRIQNVLASRRRIQSLMRDSAEYKVRAEMDLMTGLYNKVTAEHFIKEGIKKHKNSENALFIVDIDNFKSVNDIYGHQEGDHTIKIIADLLSSQFRNSDIVGRIGGDEFVIAMLNIPTKDIARAKAQELVRIMKYKPNLSIPTNVTFSIGLAFSNRKEVDYQTLFGWADEVLYKAKSTGKARYEEYGIENNVFSTEHKEIVLVCSRSRTICSKLQSVFDDSYQLLEAIDVADMERILREAGDKVSIIFVDVTDAADSGKEIWEQIQMSEAYDNCKIIAVCEEGNLKQYRNAIECGKIADVFTTPLEAGYIKKRVCRIIGR